MKKILCLILVVITLLFTFPACNSENKDETPTEPPCAPDELCLIRNGASDAIIIYPHGNTELRLTAKDMSLKIKEKFGVSIEYKTDVSVPYDANRIEILLGETDRPESRESIGKLERLTDYIYEKNGQKLVIGGPSAAATTSAIERFISKFILQASDTKTLIFKEESAYVNKLNYSINLLSCCGTKLSEYTIIYPKENYIGEYHVALSLRRRLYIGVGVNVPVADDTTDKTEFEIIIGDTNRGAQQKPEDSSFSVSVKDGDMYIAANDFTSYLAAADYLTNVLFTSDSSPDTLSEGFSYVGKATESIPERAGKYRVLFNNVWGLNNIAPYANRPNYAATFYLAYAPDVIALNEFWDQFRSQKQLAQMLKAKGYVEIIPTAKEAPSGSQRNPNSNVLPIFYDPTRLKVIESHYVHLKWYKDANGQGDIVYADDSKALIITVFEGLDESGNGNGERFILANTHLTANTKSAEHGKNSRLINVEQVWEALEPFTEKYPDTSIIIGCDFNATINSDELKKFMSYGFSRCHDTADEADNDCSIHHFPFYNVDLDYFTHGFPSSATADSSIDHIFQYGEAIDAKLFDTLKTLFSVTFSDHSPLLLDFDVIQPTTTE